MPSGLLLGGGGCAGRLKTCTLWFVQDDYLRDIAAHRSTVLGASGQLSDLDDDDLAVLAPLADTVAKFDVEPAPLRYLTPYYAFGVPPPSTTDVFVGGLVPGMDADAVKVRPPVFPLALPTGCSGA